LTEAERVEIEWNVEVNVGVLDDSLAAVLTLVYIFGVSLTCSRSYRTPSICIDR